MPQILQRKRNGSAGPFKPNRMVQLVRELADRFGLGPAFTLDACRHERMTELEGAELTTGQGRALSGHKTDRAYGGYAKFFQERALAATRKRHAHRLTNEGSTEFRNEARTRFQNDGSDDDAAIA